MFKKIKQLNENYPSPEVKIVLSYYAFGDVDRCEEVLVLSPEEAAHLLCLPYEYFVEYIRKGETDFISENDAYALKIESIRLYEGKDVFKVKPETNSIWVSRQPALRF